jgi:alkanesulfonate monooxygenase SsuD/methylene tetrahydromethanopterin reductase-like flavin-dependent oxidoreductase (luciferase family)
MDYGAHLPIIDLDGGGFSIGSILSFTDAARDLGYAALSSNDHILFARPWLDGLTALAMAIPRSGDMTLMTSLALPVIRGPAQTAKTLAAIDLLSGGRQIAGVGPGSSRADYQAVGLDFEERWKRIDDAVLTLRALWRGDNHKGRFYSTEGVTLAPAPAQLGGPPIWLGSWGSAAGLRRTARFADGWLASAYNTTPAELAAGWQALLAALPPDKDAASFPNTLATMWSYVTDSESERQHHIDALAALLNREPDFLAARLPIGAPEHCAAILRAYEQAGVQRVLIWPLADPLTQLEAFMTRVTPLV